MNTALLGACAFVALAASSASAEINGPVNSGYPGAAIGKNPARVSVRTAESKSAAAPEANDFTFVSLTTITINDSQTPPTVASPYPSNILVDMPALTTVTKVRVVLYGFSHTFPDDVDVILVGPQGQRAVLMSDAGGGAPGVSSLQLDFSMGAGTPIPDETTLTTGAFRPANYEAASDTFPFPGPGALTDAPSDLRAFNYINPNGTWSLYVVDDASQDAGQIAEGWDLILTVPTVFTVNSVADPGDGTCDATECTLREAIAAAQNDDLINFSALFNTPQTINLLTALPDIDNSVTIQGPGAHLLTVRRDYNAPTEFRVFTIPTGVANGVVISGMTIAGGSASGGLGGGISSRSNLTLTGVHITGNQAVFGGGGVFLREAEGIFTGCTFSDNAAILGSSGGAINYQGVGRTLRLVNSTVSGNRGNSAGGIITFGSGNVDCRLEIVGSTITNNVAGVHGGGIYTVTTGGGTSAATTTLRNSIIANNSANSFHNLAAVVENGAAATVQTLGFNLSDNFNGVFTPQPGTDIDGATPRLGPLSLGSGTTPTHALLGGSPALDAGNGSGLTTDQRGAPRIADTAGIPSVSDGADIGAVEMQSLIVDSTGDGGTGSLRNTIANANSNAALSDIIFDPPTFDTAQTINLLSALPDITGHTTFNGPGAHLLTVRRDPNAATDFRIFNVALGINGGTAFSGMTITGGRATAAGDGQLGGGIYSNASSLTLTNVHITGNRAGSGGGVYLFSADGVFTGCTFSGNTVDFDGGGIDFVGNGGRTLRLLSSTVSGNQVNSGGAGIFIVSNNGNSPLEVVSSTIANNTGIFGGGIETFTKGGTGNTATTTLRNSIIAGNTPTNLAATEGGGAATFITHGFNLASDDGGGFLNVAPITTDKINANAGLAPIANNGGGTPIHGLMSTSAALDAGNSSGLTSDQRGFFRPADLVGLVNVSDGADIGAVEAQLIAAGALSRKVHGGSGTFDINLLTAPLGIECRAAGAGGSYQVIATFASQVLIGGVSIMSADGLAGGSLSVAGTTATVDLTAVASAQTLGITLLNVTNGSSTDNVFIPLSVLVGDTTGNSFVNSSDITQAKGQSGQAVTGSNFRTDVTANGGTINTSDIGLVKSRSGTSLP